MVLVDRWYIPPCLFFGLPPCFYDGPAAEFLPFAYVRRLGLLIMRSVNTSSYCHRVLSSSRSLSSVSMKKQLFDPWLFCLTLRISYLWSIMIRDGVSVVRWFVVVQILASWQAIQCGWRPDFKQPIKKAFQTSVLLRNWSATCQTFTGTSQARSLQGLSISVETRTPTNNFLPSIQILENSFLYFFICC